MNAGITLILTLVIDRHFTDNAKLREDMTGCSCPRSVREGFGCYCAMQHKGGDGVRMSVHE